MEIRDINHIEQAAGKSRPELLRFGLALLFVIGIMFYTWASGGGNIMLIVAGMIGGYMALNIGANDYFSTGFPVQSRPSLRRHQIGRARP